MRYFPNMLQMIHEILLLQVCYCNLKFLMPLRCCHAVGLCSVITETCKQKKNPILNVYVFWDMPLCRCPSIYDVSENCNDVVFMVKRSVGMPGTIYPTTWLPFPVDLNIGRNIAVRTSNLNRILPNMHLNLV